MTLARLSEELAIVATIDPDVHTAAAYTTDVIDMDDFRRVIFIVMTGAMVATSTVDFVVKGDTASGGSFTTTVTGKSITQLTAAGTDDDKQVIVEVTSEECGLQGFRFLRGTLTVGTADSDASVIALAGGLRYSPASDFDLASVDEIVA